ncbi:ovarian fibroin-like substance-1-like precursor [Acyrthosiphon pisum]|uniref:ACYPI008446 protein n=1 Tax=Acyrthosiphon pisum TaxID=7029 RepID=C4WUD1_ACYPI|nr:ovarian fibroin-like substance-1-like precursor [Acyrthosiphon pisum]BAH71501.1 ACYPI008446 [Acyrthosiphon pisum]|eukprot:NP_001156266.1 ovarian fibroin-like substance-1-like precursor [Acyrthosiphon pisum]
MNYLSIVLVIALVGYSLGAPQHARYELEEESEQINPEPRHDSNERNGNTQRQVAGTKGGRIQGYGNTQRQVAGTKGGRIRSYGNSQGQVAGTKGGRIQGYGNSQGQVAGTKGGRIQGHDNNQGQGEYRQTEHSGYHAPEQQYGNNPGCDECLEQYRY